MQCELSLNTHHGWVECHPDGEGASNVFDLDGELEDGGEVVLQQDVVLGVAGQPGEVPGARGHPLPGAGVTLPLVDRGGRGRVVEGCTPTIDPTGRWQLKLEGKRPRQGASGQGHSGTIRKNFY